LGGQAEPVGKAFEGSSIQILEGKDAVPGIWRGYVGEELNFPFPQKWFGNGVKLGRSKRGFSKVMNVDPFIPAGEGFGLSTTGTRSEQ
jgi:hypothetical protein